MHRSPYARWTDRTIRDGASPLGCDIGDSGLRYQMSSGNRGIVLAWGYNTGAMMRAQCRAVICAIPDASGGDIYARKNIGPLRKKQLLLFALGIEGFQ